MKELVLHPTCGSGPIEQIRAELAPTAQGCRARFVFSGDISAIKVPELAQPRREDDLWKTTCCEIFWQPDGADAYREFNLSPSGKWAVYDFDAFREGMRDAPVVGVAVSCTAQEAQLVLEADIAADLPRPASIALNAIVEDAAGHMQFWALAFADGKPEFHSETCRQLRVEMLR